jgi:hypothetical protein
MVAVIYKSDSSQYTVSVSSSLFCHIDPLEGLIFNIKQRPVVIGDGLPITPP